MSTLMDLHLAIAEVCPIEGVSCGKLNDRRTWSIQPTPKATPDQITAANTILNTFSLDGILTTVDPMQDKLDALQQQVETLQAKVDQL